MCEQLLTEGVILNACAAKDHTLQTTPKDPYIELIDLLSKTHLTAKFKLGKESGQKAYPASVGRAMVSAKDASGNRLFTSDDFLASSQIAGFLSRLSAKKTLQDEEEFEDDF